MSTLQGFHFLNLHGIKINQFILIQTLDTLDSI